MRVKKIKLLLNSFNIENYLLDKMQQYTQVVAEYDNSDTISFVFGLERISNSDGKYYLTDGQGSVRQLTDASGNITDNYTFDAFGNIVSKSGTTGNDFLYTGEQLDANSGYYYLRARWMDVSSGRFVSVDPFAGDPNAPISLHRYLYAGLSPLTYVDPGGESYVMAVYTASISNIMASIAIPTYIGVVSEVAAMAAVTYGLNEVSRQLFNFAPIDVGIAGVVGTGICAKEFYDFWKSEEFRRAQRKKTGAKHYLDIWGPSLPSAPKKNKKLLTVPIHKVKISFYIHGGGGRIFQLRYRIGKNAFPGNGYFLFRADYMDYRTNPAIFGIHWHLRWGAISKDHIPF